MLIVFIVVEITRILLDLIHAQALRIDFLGSEVEGFEPAIDLTLLLTILVRNPNTLNVLA